MKTTATLALLAGSAMLLGSCQINNGKVDFSWVGDRVQPAENDSVDLESRASGPSADLSTPHLAANAAGAGAVSGTPAPTYAAAYATPAAAGTYVVQKGDTLLAIANRHHSSVAAISAANGITNPRALHVGQALRIPGGSTATRHAAAKPAVAKAAPKPTGTGKYTIRRGDTLSGISARTHVPMASIMRANGMKTSALHAGSTIIIPKR
ncbi:MAG: LysM peptidoglycan-binding domain-containing protein [Akkermansia sp.]|nr:LysM peptidoglycan-binding domain-containing protein [Akkermansia sp.]